MNATPSKTELQLLDKFLEYSHARASLDLNQASDSDLTDTPFLSVLSTWVNEPFEPGFVPEFYFRALQPMFSDYAEFAPALLQHIDELGYKLELVPDLLADDETAAVVNAVNKHDEKIYYESIDAFINAVAGNSLWRFDFRETRFTAGKNYYVHGDRCYCVSSEKMYVIKRILKKEEVVIKTMPFSEVMGICPSALIFIHSENVAAPLKKSIVDDGFAYAEKPNNHRVKHAYTFEIINGKGDLTSLTLPFENLGRTGKSDVIADMANKGLQIHPQPSVAVDGLCFFDHAAMIFKTLQKRKLLKTENKFEASGWSFDDITSTNELIRDSHPRAVGPIENFRVTSRAGEHALWCEGFKFAMGESKFLQFFAAIMAGSYLRGFQGDPLIQFSPIPYVYGMGNSGKSLMLQILKTMEGFFVGGAVGGGSTLRGLSQQFTISLNNGTAFVDELSQFLKEKTTGQFISDLMELANGGTRVTATSDSMRQKLGYQVVLIITGNLALDAMLAASNNDQAQPLRQRLLTLNADKLGYRVEVTDRATGVAAPVDSLFKRDPGEVGAEVFSRWLSKNHGTAFQRIVSVIQKKGPQLQRDFKQFKANFAAEMHEISSQRAFIDRFADPMALAEIGRTILCDPLVLNCQPDDPCFAEFDSFLDEIRTTTLTARSDQDDEIWVHETLIKVLARVNKNILLSYAGLFTPDGNKDTAQTAVLAHNANHRTDRSITPCGVIRLPTLKGKPPAAHVQSHPEDWPGVWYLSKSDFGALRKIFDGTNRYNSDIDFNRLVQLATSIGVLTETAGGQVKVFNTSVKYTFAFDLDKAAALAETRRSMSQATEDYDEDLATLVATYDAEVPGFAERFKAELASYAAPLDFTTKQSWNYVFLSLMAPEKQAAVREYRQDLVAKARAKPATGGSILVDGQRIALSAEKRDEWLAAVKKGSDWDKAAAIEPAEARQLLAATLYKALKPKE